MKIQGQNVEAILKKYYKLEGLIIADFIIHFESTIIRQCGVNIRINKKSRIHN